MLYRHSKLGGFNLFTIKNDLFYFFPRVCIIGNRVHGFQICLGVKYLESNGYCRVWTLLFSMSNSFVIYFRKPLSAPFFGLLNCFRTWIINFYLKLILVFILFKNLLRSWRCTRGNFESKW